MSMTPDQLRVQLEKHGLPIWGTDEQLAARYDANFKPIAPQPNSTAPKQTFRGRPKGAVASKVVDIEPKTDVANELLANRASSMPVEAEEVNSDNINTDQ